MVVFMVIFVVLCAAIGGPSYFAGMAYRYGNLPLFWACIAILVPALGAVIYLSVPRWGGKLQERLVQRLYAKEGRVAFSAPCECKKSWGLVLAGFLGTCIAASVMIEVIVEIPFKYMQPISALYIVPFLVGVWFLTRPMVGYVPLLWPALYTIHAILIVAGAPILFTNPWEYLNMLVPVAGYGVLTGLVGHFYSRFALRQLKRLTQDDPAVAHLTEEVNGL